MKKIQLKSVELGQRCPCCNEEKVLKNKVPYKDMLMAILNRHPEGIQTSEMRSILKLMDKVESATDALVLEDAEYEKLKACLSRMVWAFPHRELIAFEDAVLSAESVAVSS